MMLSTISGRFDDFHATLSYQDESFTNPVISFWASAASVNTQYPKRDQHLRSSDFFDAESFPKITFRSTSLEPNHINGDFLMRGILGIRGIEHEMNVDVEYGGTITDNEGKVRCGFSLYGKISRSNFGMTWNKPLACGGALISDDVRLQGNMQFILEQK